MSEYYNFGKVDISPQPNLPQEITVHSCTIDAINSKLYDNYYLGQ